jgi:hypothetical protein
MACEKCWGDAYLRMLATGKPQTDCYHELLAERVLNPCTKSEQEGQYGTRDSNKRAAVDQ